MLLCLIGLAYSTGVPSARARLSHLGRGFIQVFGWVMRKLLQDMELLQSFRAEL